VTSGGLLLSFLSLSLEPAAILAPERLELLHQQRVEWMKSRTVHPPHGVYQDFRAAEAPRLVLPFRVQELAKKENIQILLTDREPRFHNGVLWFQKPDSGFRIPPLPNLLQSLPTPRELKRLLNSFKLYPVEFAGLTGGAFSWLKLDASDVPLAPVVQHVLARELKEEEVRLSLAENRTYLAEEWLCDTAGFAFWAVNNQGVFEIGDRVPLQNNTRVEARLPVRGKIKLFRNGVAVNETESAALQFRVPGPGAYHLEVDLDVAGEARRWIRTQPIQLLDSSNPALPRMSYQDDSVTSLLNIPYVENSTEPKQKLDLYLPKDKTNFPLFVFIHGGSWASGDRGLYGPLGVVLAKRGIGVAIPSYRLLPKNPHPAQVDDVAAAFAWVVKNVKQHGADENRIFLGGHSAGGHLSSLVALDKSLLAKHAVDPAVIKGVAALSGVYDLSLLPMFGDPESRRKASPMQYVRRDAPPFLVTYCQWDYLGLPLQAKDLSLALKRAFVPTRLLYVPGETHISEVIAMLKDGDPTLNAIVRFVETGQP
jgi:acetyl esterase/lipase